MYDCPVWTDCAGCRIVVSDLTVMHKWPVLFEWAVKFELTVFVWTLNIQMVMPIWTDSLIRMVFHVKQRVILEWTIMFIFYFVNSRVWVNSFDWKDIAWMDCYVWTDSCVRMNSHVWMVCYFWTDCCVRTDSCVRMVCYVWIVCYLCTNCLG